jgi:hypothetical protein
MDTGVGELAQRNDDVTVPAGMFTVTVRTIVLLVS